MSSARKPRRKSGYVGIYPRKLSRGWVWRPKLQVDGKSLWGPAFDTQAEAFEAWKRMKAKHEQAQRIGELTLAQAFDKTVEALLANGGSEVTAKGYRQKFARWSTILNPEAPVLDVTPDHIEGFKAERRRKHKASPNTVRGDLVVLGRVFKVAGFTEAENPARRVERPKTREPERPFFTIEEAVGFAERILASERQNAELHHDLVMFITFTGARAFECERVRAADFTLLENGGTVRITQHKGTARRFRQVAFGKRLVGVMARLKARTGRGPFMRATTVSVVLKRWQRRLKEPRLSARALRRTYATALNKVGDLRLVQHQMGHTNLTTTQKYLGVQAEEALRAAHRLDEQLAALIGS